jgi:rubrerythrin
VRAAAVWRHRARIELEAAALFEQLAWSIGASGYPRLAARARAAANDERRHVRRCRAIVEALGGAPADLDEPPPAAPDLGVPGLTPRDRALYAAVAIGCVTESLSCALLLELRAAATHPLVAATVDEIVKDEIEHARIGWAVLAAEAERRDVGWLAAHVPAMAAAAVADEVSAAAGDPELAGLGVLPRARIRALVGETWASLIGPGLARHRIAPPPP